MYVLLLVHVPSRLVGKTSSMQEVPLCIASGQIWSARLSCSALQCIATCCSVMQCVAVCCSVLQCVAVWCSVAQCGAIWCSMMQCVAVCVAVCCSVMKCLVACCRVLSDPWKRCLLDGGRLCTYVRTYVYEYVYVHMRGSMLLHGAAARDSLYIPHRYRHDTYI